MYNNNDLEQAVDKGIFSADAVAQFRHYIHQRDNTHVVDEETFKLVTSFNDIFVVMACGLLMFSAAWAVLPIHHALASALVAILSWAAAELFVRRRKMALPGIFLLTTFIGGVFFTLFFVSNESPLVAALFATIAAYVHWWRFHVPITVAAGVGSAVIFVISSILTLFPAATHWLTGLILIAGLAVFALAMRWDMADRQRLTGKADVAFWLHLSAAPMIVHPIFTNLGIQAGNQSTTELLVVIILYVGVTLLSLIIDRRAFMVSALGYVLIALVQLFDHYGFNSLAYVGIFIGFSLLMLSGFWHKARAALVRRLPSSIQALVPALS